jgi:hypothetical protein
MTTSTTERPALHARAATHIALRYAGVAGMAGTLQPATGEMTWSTCPAKGADDLGDEPAGTFAVVDGQLLVAYRADGADWLRIGTATFGRDEVGIALEHGLSARELVLTARGRTIRLRADGDPAAEAFAVELAG